MPNRVTGLNSGLDTESLVTSLVSNYQKKVDNLTGYQKRLEWKQASWKSLNSSFVSFYSGPLDTMSMKSSYMKKVTTSTNAGAVSITTKDGAMNATQKMKVNRIASSAFTTGAKIKTQDNSAVKGSTKLKDLGSSGLTAGKYYTTELKFQDVEKPAFEADGVTPIWEMEEDGVTPKTDADGNNIQKTVTVQEPVWEMEDDGVTPKTDASGNRIQETYQQEHNGYTLKINVGGINEDGTQNVNGSVTLNFGEDATINQVIDAIKNAKFAGSDTRFNANFDEAQGRIYMSATATGAAGNFTFEGDDALITALGLKAGDGEGYAKYNRGDDAEIELNGVKYQSGSGTFDINGLTITANEVTDKEFTITTKTDTSGIYDMIKDMLKQYNEMIKTLDTAYYADSSAKYNMLTDDEKYAMSDREVEEWEKKIKDGLLAKDSTLYDVTSGVKSVMSAGINVTLADGSTKTMYLSDFGIGTGSYLTTEKGERGVYHIDGDKDDTVSKSNEDKLQAWIASDPDAVADYFSKLAQNLRSKMFDQMRTTDFSSSFTIYEDKLMASQYSDYNTKITNATSALNKKQDAYYAKFSKMEVAMAKINSVQSNLSGYFGS